MDNSIGIEFPYAWNFYPKQGEFLIVFSFAAYHA